MIPISGVPVTPSVRTVWASVARGAVGGLEVPFVRCVLVVRSRCLVRSLGDLGSEINLAGGVAAAEDVQSANLHELVVEDATVASLACLASNARSACTALGTFPSLFKLICCPVSLCLRNLLPDSDPLAISLSPLASLLAASAVADSETISGSDRDGHRSRKAGRGSA